MDNRPVEAVYKTGSAILTIVCVVDLVREFLRAVIYGSDKMIVLVTAFCYLFVFVGWWQFAGLELRLRKRREKCIVTVAAVIKDVKIVEHRDEDGVSYSYYAIYEYEWNDKQYITKSKDDYGKKPPLGSMVKLLIDPKDPADLYEVELEVSRIKSGKVVGFIFMIMGGLSVVMCRV